MSLDVLCKLVVIKNVKMSETELFRCFQKLGWCGGNAYSGLEEEEQENVTEGEQTGNGNLD